MRLSWLRRSRTFVGRDHHHQPFRRRLAADNGLAYSHVVYGVFRRENEFSEAACRRREKAGLSLDTPMNRGRAPGAFSRSAPKVAAWRPYPGLFTFVPYGDRRRLSLTRCPFTIYGLPFTIHTSRFTIHNSQFTIHDSRFTIHDSRFTIRDSRFTIYHLRLTRYVHSRQTLAAAEERGRLACDEREPRKGHAA